MVTNDLMRALRLDLAGEREQALGMLAQLVCTAPDDFRVWWALANLSPSPAEVRMALRRVLQLKADHNEAYEMLAALDQPVAPLHETHRMSRMASV